MRRPLGVVAATAVLFLPALPASAGTSYTQVSLSATITGSTVSASTSVKASPATTVAQYGICVRDAAGAAVDFPNKATNVAITLTGVAYSSTGTFAPGTYTYFPCVLGSSWFQPGPFKKFTVTAPIPPSPIPSPSPLSTPTPTPSVSQGAGAVLFEDDFSGPVGAYDHSKWGEWSSCTYEASAAYGNIKCGDRAAIDGQGHLSIPATPTQGTSISTADHFSFTYGTITARMFIPSEGGYWPAFWTLNNYPNPGQQGGDAPIVGEADVLEAYTSLANGYRDAVHNWSGSTSWSGGDDTLNGLGHTIGEWHDYSARFEPGKITYLRDGVQVGMTATKEQGAGKPYAYGPDITRGNWLILTLAIGGASGQQDGKAVVPSHLLVDRVEVRGL